MLGLTVPHLEVASATPPNWQANGGLVAGIGSNGSPTWPTHQADDIGLLVVECSPETSVVSLSVPAGFAEVTNSPQPTTTGIVGTRLSVFWCRATSGAMSAPTFTTTPSSNKVVAAIITFRGCIATGDPWDVTGGSVKSTASTSTSIGALTVGTASCLMVYLASSSANATMSSEANAALTNLGERFEGGTTASDDGAIHIWSGELPGTGSSGTFTATSSGSVENAYLALALKPAA